MPRFEFSEGASNKFWEIELKGKSLICKFGKIGSNGQTTLKDFGSAAEAKAGYDKMIAGKTKKGYQPAGAGKAGKAAKPEAPAVTHAHNAKLEAAIEAHPDDADGYLVYADWLQGQGDPRGELIVLQHANKGAPANKLLERNAEHFFGKLAELQDLLERFEYDPLGQPTTWRWGYLEKAWISNKHDHSSEFGEGTKVEVGIDEAVGWL